MTNTEELEKLSQNLAQDMVEDVNKKNREEYGDNWRERMLTEDLPLTNTPDTTVPIECELSETPPTGTTVEETIREFIEAHFGGWTGGVLDCQKNKYYAVLMYSSPDEFKKALKALLSKERKE